MEEIIKNIDAIEEEKKEYLEEHPDGDKIEENDEEKIEEIVEEDKEVEIIEVSFDEEEINK